MPRLPARPGRSPRRERACTPADDADASRLIRRHLDRKTPWRLVKKYCRAAGIDSDRLGGRGIGLHSLRKTAINDAIRNGATMHEVREFAGHADIRTTAVHFVRREEDAEVAARPSRSASRVGRASEPAMRRDVSQPRTHSRELPTARGAGLATAPNHGNLDKTRIPLS